MDKLTVMLDPGHGGGDPGALGGGLREADLVLQLALREAELWRARGVEPILTRSTDRYVDLKARTAQENAQRPACFISHHMDAAVGERACGPTVWLHSKAPQSYLDWGADTLGGILAAGMSTNRSQGVNRGYRGNPGADYAVNRDTLGPSMLIEFGFITSPANRREFQEHLDGLARAVVESTARFLGLPELPEAQNPRTGAPRGAGEPRGVRGGEDFICPRLESPGRI